MAFIVDGGGNVLSFAEYTDVVQKDQRLLESNVIKIPAESGFADVTEFIEDMLTNSTDRILLKLKESEEVSKITYYDAKFNSLYNELIAIADWYDYDNDGTIQADEKAITYQRTRRSRSRRSIVQVR
jgi:hypothetical protein